jgi:hypothetical protein
VLLKIALALFFLTGCSGNYPNTSGVSSVCYSGTSPGTISISPKPASIPAGTSVTFTATIGGDVSSAPTWRIAQTGVAAAR